MFDVVALGECLIDFTYAGKNSSGINIFEQNPGGAPANVLAMNSILGGKTAFIGKVGKDSFGDYLESVLKKADIDTTHLYRDEKIPTTLAFVQLDESGDRSFTFYRKPGADIMLGENEISEKLLSNTRVFHFGSVSLTDEPSRGATIKAAELAKSSGVIVSYDPNYRPLLWENEEVARKVMTSVISYADILKVSEEEMILLTEETDYEKAAKTLSAMGPSVVLITLGPDGAYFYTPVGSGLIKTYDVKAVDTTGAGDAFVGGLLYCINNSDKKLDEITIGEWQKIVRFSNACGSLTTTKTGAIPAMPTRDEIDRCISSKDN